MSGGAEITAVLGRRVFDSRGRPTVEAEIQLASGAHGRAIAPAGASTGSGEALDRRDGGDAFGGYDVGGAVGSVRDEIAEALLGLDAREQRSLDTALVALDPTSQRSRLGGNALIATSMAVAHAAAAHERLPLWRYLHADADGPADDEARLPLPEIQIFGGGAHAAGRVDVQDFMCIAVGAQTFGEALEWTADVYRAAGRLLDESGRLQGVADEGGWWPAFDGNEEGLALLLSAIERAGLKPGEQVAISLDIAASELGAAGRYTLARDERELDTGELIDLLEGWIDRYPIVSIEDPLAEDDPDGLRALTERVGGGVQVIGDDFLVTNAARVEQAVALGACNALLVKPNQAGTLSETKAALDAAQAAGWGAVVSARSGETEDVTIAHLAVGWGAQQLKVGSFARSERMAKWNEAIRIGEALASGDRLPPSSAFPWGREP